MLKRLIGNTLRRLGYHAIHREILKDIGLCLHLSRLFRTQEIDTVFDVGANRGQYYRLLRKGVGFNGTILSFEPISELNQILIEESKEDPRWHVLPFALGDKEQQMEINIMRAKDLSSFLSPVSKHTNRFVDSNTPTKTELVEIKTLDNIYCELCENYQINKAYLKMDTQGFDLNVVRGGEQVISNFIALQAEACVLPLYENMPDYRTTIHSMNESGFELSAVFPVSIDEKLRLIEFDCVFVNRDRIVLVPAERH